MLINKWILSFLTLFVAQASIAGVPQNSNVAHHGSSGNTTSSVLDLPPTDRTSIMLTSGASATNDGFYMVLSAAGSTLNAGISAGSYTVPAAHQTHCYRMVYSSALAAGGTGYIQFGEADTAPTHNNNTAPTNPVNFGPTSTVTDSGLRIIGQSNAAEYATDIDVEFDASKHPYFRISGFAASALAVKLFCKEI